MTRIFSLTLFLFWLNLSDELLDSCQLCNILLPIGKILVDRNRSSLIEPTSIEICEKFRLAESDVCRGMIKEYSPVVIEILRFSPLKTEEICGVTFDCLPQSNISALIWNVTIPASRLLLDDSTMNSTTNYSILHLADLHIDLDYRVGSNGDCGRPLCCRDGTAKIGENGAGFWGDYRNCDLPVWTSEKIFEHLIETEQNLDWIYFTGDIAPHDVWQQTEIKDLQEISFTTNLLKRMFPDKRIFPCLGNHEAAPPDLFPTKNFTWLYTFFADQWSFDPETRKTILLGGFYTTKVTSNLRLIALNTNFCSENNYWLLINATDPLGQLQWVKIGEIHKLISCSLGAFRVQKINNLSMTFSFPSSLMNDLI